MDQPSGKKAKTYAAHIRALLIQSGP